jgi:hypothetical protein
MNAFQIHVPIGLLENFASRNGFKIVKKKKDGVCLYRLERLRIPTYFISGDDVQDFKFVDISDLHIGNPSFDERALRRKLAMAVSQGYRDVFIAGDIFEGVVDENVEYMPYAQQIELARSIFKDYDLTYYAINGNHDYTFEQQGLQNPIKRLETLLRKDDGIDFKFFDAYLMDFIICGVIKRVMHVERQDFDKKSIFAILKLKMFDEQGMLLNTFGDNVYPVRFFQVGHIHVNVQMYYGKKMVYISQPGSFIKEDRLFDRANFISGRVIDKRVFMN